MARTTHRSSKGRKLYAVRGKDGTFKDIQTYKRAHGADVKRKSASETMAAAKKKPAKKTVAKKAAKRPAKKMTRKAMKRPAAKK
jgi:hypothetical protein